MFGNDYIQTWNGDRLYLNLKLDSSLSDLDLDSKPHWCEKVKTNVSVIISHHSELICMTFGVLL